MPLEDTDTCKFTWSWRRSCSGPKVEKLIKAQCELDRNFLSWCPHAAVDLCRKRKLFMCSARTCECLSAAISINLNFPVGICTVMPARGKASAHLSLCAETSPRSFILAAFLSNTLTSRSRARLSSTRISLNLQGHGSSCSERKACVHIYAVLTLATRGA